MFTTQISDPNNPTSKNYQESVPNLVMKGFDSYMSLETKIHNLVENIEKSRIEIMDEMEIKNYPFISAFMQKKSAEI
jgi:hypothetical protein